MTCECECHKNKTIADALLEPVYRLTRDMARALAQAGGGITDTEARYLVDIYYTMQDQRVRANNQVKALARDAKRVKALARAAGETKEVTEEPHEALDFVLTQFKTLEENVARLLGVYAENHPMFWFFEQTVGIGPILTAGLVAHIDIHQAPTPGHIYRFAGYDPTTKWEKRTKRPWNADLKKLCWKIGDSFVKFSGHERGFYGRLYRERKAREWRRNLAGELQEQAAAALSAKRFDTKTDAYSWYSGECDPDLAASMLEEGKPPTAAACRAKDGKGTPMLPPGHIDSRARRWAVKLFLSHLQECWWRQATGTEPPNPYPIEHQGHVHKISPPQIPPPLPE